MNRDEILKQSTHLQRDFERDGYVSLPAFFDPAEVAELRANKERFVRDVVPSMPENEVYYDDKDDPDTLKQLQQMGRHDAFFGGLVEPGSKLTALAEACLGEAVRAVNLQYFNKSPQASTPTPPHQDGYYFHLVPNHAITMWMALEDVAPEQGCVHYVEGSQRYGMRAHAPSGTLGFSQSIVDFGIPHDLAHEKSFPCKAGHLIAHHSLTIHWATGNTSGDRTRQALGAIYYAARCEEDTRAKQAYQARLAENLASEGKI